MKKNLPVTQNEIPFPQGHLLVSRTDLKGCIGLHGMQASNQTLDAAYQEYFEPVQQVGWSMQKMDAAFRYVVIGSESRQDTSSFSEKIAVELAELLLLRSKLESRAMPTAEREVLAEFEMAQSEYVDKGVLPAIAVLKEGNAEHARVIATTKIEPLYQVVRAKAQAVELYFKQHGEARRQQAAENYRATVKFSLLGVLASLLIMLTASQFQARTILLQII
jgi:Four helix bundle sensory module for signal transduction